MTYPLPPEDPAGTVQSAVGRPFHWPSAVQFAIGLIASLALLALTIALLAIGLADLAIPSFSADVTSIFLMAGGLILCVLLILPSVGYASARLFNRPFNLPAWLDLKTWQRGIILLPVVILVGNWISSQEVLAWMLLPLFHVIALGLPILWLLWRGMRGLSLRDPQMAWGIFATGLVVSPTIILVLEMVAGGIVFFITLFFLSSDRAAIMELRGLLEQIGSTSNQNVDILLSNLEPYLTRPPVAFTIFAFAAGIVPIIEETIKPIGVWLLPGRGTTPADGFVAGLLCGAGYALFENLALASQAEGWALAVTARAGTSVLHMVTTGLLGWAIVLAWRKRRYGLLLLVYMTSITIHGLWNALTLLSISNLINVPDNHPLAIIQHIGVAAPVGLGALFISSLAILLVANRSFRPGRTKLTEETSAWT